MEFGLSLPPFGEHADPRLIRSLAVDAEAAGWDGFFLWDHMVVPQGAAARSPTPGSPSPPWPPLLSASASGRW